MVYSKFKTLLFFALLAVLVVAWGFRDQKRYAQRLNNYYKIKYDARIFNNPDSLMYYAHLAYIEEDTKGLGITGTAAFLFDGDTSAQDTLPIVSTDEGAIMLLRSAELGSDDALWVITVLNYHGLWTHSLPENIEKYEMPRTL